MPHMLRMKCIYVYIVLELFILDILSLSGAHGSHQQETFFTIHIWRTHVPKRLLPHTRPPRSWEQQYNLGEPTHVCTDWLDVWVKATRTKVNKLYFSSTHWSHSTAQVGWSADVRYRISPCQHLQIMSIVKVRIVMLWWHYSRDSQRCAIFGFPARQGGSTVIPLCDGRLLR